MNTVRIMSSPGADESSSKEISNFSFVNNLNGGNSQINSTEPTKSATLEGSEIEESLDTSMERSDEEDSSDENSEDSFSSMDSPGVSWGTNLRTMLWIQEQKSAGVDPRKIIVQALGSNAIISEHIPEATLWEVVAEVLTDPPRRHKLRHVNSIEIVVELLRNCKNIMVLTGAGVSVSCGIPDFRSKDGIYSRLAKEFPNLPDPQSMFDIQYFCRDPRPFYQFAREIYPGQFRPSTCHRFIKILEQRGQLLRNYTQNIDTLERAAGIENVVECHGSFATATCTKCEYISKAEDIRDDIFAQRIPMCPVCSDIRHQNNELNSDDLESLPVDKLVEMGIMKPDIVFFGEGLGGKFHKFIANDKTRCDLLIVIGSSLRVHPVALIPRSISPDVPQILINREQLGHMNFDVELLGDSDTIITQLCKLLGGDFEKLSEGHSTLTLTRELKPRLNYCKQITKKMCKSHSRQDDPGMQSIRSGFLSNASLGSFCDSGFESTSSSLNNGNSMNHTNKNMSMENINDSSLPISKQFGNDETSKWLTFKPSCSSTDTCPKLIQEERICTVATETLSKIPPKNEVFSRSNFSLKPSKEGNILEGAVFEGNDEYININMAEYLPDGTFYNHSKKRIYVFPGAQGYLSSCEDSSSESDSEEEDESINKSEIAVNTQENSSSFFFESVSKKRKRLDSYD